MSTVPRAVFRGAPAGLDGFVAAFTTLGGHVHRVSSLDDVGDAIAKAADGREPVLTAPGVPEIHADLHWPDCGAEAAATAMVGVVRPVAAVAATGSFVVDSRAGRSPSLLPPVCIFVVDVASIVDTPSDVLRDRERFWPDGLPSQIVLVTGPSRSGDIEMTLAVGVHGPGEVHAVLVD